MKKAREVGSGEPVRSTPADYRAAVELRLALRDFARKTEDVTRAVGLTPERYQLLLLIRVAEAGEATVTRLARQLQMAQTAVTQLVRRAEDGGLVTRSLSGRDARVHLLALTADGEQRLGRAVAGLRGERDRLRRRLAGDADV